MKNMTKRIVYGVIGLALSTTLYAGEFDSSSPLPAMAAVALASKTAGKAYGDYLSLRKKENEIVAELTSPAFERLPRSAKAVKKAENLVALGQIIRQENTQLKTYKVHVGYAMASFGKVGPGQMAAAQAHLEGIRTAMVADIGRQTVTAGALARAASLGGLSQQQKRQFKNYVKHLENKQVMEERFRASGKDLAGAAITVESVVEYMDEVNSYIDMAIAETEANMALNTGAKAIQIGEEISYRLCGEKVCTPETMFPKGPDHSALIAGFGPSQEESVEEEKITEAYINKYAR